MPVTFNMSFYNVGNEQARESGFIRVSKPFLIMLTMITMILGFGLGFVCAVLMLNSSESGPVAVPKPQPPSNQFYPSYPYYQPAVYGFCPVYLSKSTHLITDSLSKLNKIETNF